MENILIAFLFFGAVAYLVQNLRKQFRPEKGCAKNCGCSHSPKK